MARIYVSQDEVQQLDIVRWKVYEGESRDGSYQQVDVVEFSPTVSYVEFATFIDIAHWFKLSFIDSAGVESELSAPTLAEEMDSIITKIREELHDTNLDSPAFSDAEYITSIRAAAKTHGGYINLIDVPEGDWEYVSILVRINFCYKLANDNAKYYHLQLPNGLALSKNERVAQYVSIAESLQKYYNELIRPNRTDKDGYSTSGAKIKCANLQRKSYFTGRTLIDNINSPITGRKNMFGEIEVDDE